MDIVSAVIETIIVVLFVMGAGLVLFDDLQNELRRYTLKRGLRQNGHGGKYAGKLIMHLNPMLAVIPGRRRPTAEAFIAGSLMLGLVCGVMLARCGAFVAGILIMVPAAMLPYGILRMRFMSARAIIDNEGEAFVTALVTGYRLCGENISEALEYAAAQKDQLPKTSELASLFLLHLRDARNVNEIKNAGTFFVDAIGSSWAETTADAVCKAYFSGSSISLILGEVLEQLREESVLKEERNRMNSETRRMTLVMIPLTALLMCFMGVRQLGMSPAQILANQFADTTATVLLIATLAVFAFNLAAVELMDAMER